VVRLIKVLYGERGTQKTEKIINMANEALKETKGDIIFICKDSKYILSLDHKIRYISAADYDVNDPERFIGFISGLLAGNFDIEKMFLAGCPRLGGFEDASRMGAFLNNLKKISDSENIDFVLSVRGNMEEVPPFMKPYII
jgi:hypothetical protein